MIRRAETAREGRGGSAARLGGALALSTCVGATAACSAEPSAVRAPSPALTSVVEAAPTATAEANAAPRVEYLLADVERRPKGTWIALEKGRYGVLLEGARAIASDAGVTMVPESADSSIQRVERVPTRLGGGFLFRTLGGLYASATFDGPLRPVIALSGIADISFGPDAILLRDNDGARWLVDLATGQRKPIAPLGLTDVAALDDGRAVALIEGGGVSVSTDGGKTWRNATSQLQTAPALALAQDGEIWISEVQGRALRVDRSGALVEVLQMPSAPAPKQDPRFGSGDTPLRVALRAGVRVGPWAAVIGVGGDVIRVDLATGAIAATFPGVIPLRMTCEAVEIPDDVALVCVEKGKASVVVTGLLHGKRPRVERAFPTDGPFFGGLDGALAYSGPCGDTPDRSQDPAPIASVNAGVAPPGPRPTVCVRNGDGQWEPFLLDEANGAPSSSAQKRKAAQVATSPSATPATSSPPPPAIRPSDVRWIPRIGRAPFAVIATKQTLASYDAAWGEIRPWLTDGQPSAVLDALRSQAPPSHATSIVERRWVATGSGAVQGILDDGRGVEISPDGAIQIWPFTFDKVALDGPLGFAKGGGGRAFQTLDRGRSWDEVAAPPALQSASFDPKACSPLGCDLGSWMRIGWNPTPPATRPDVTKAALPQAPPVTPPIEMACLATGRAEARALTLSAEHPFDLALGATRFPARFDDVELRFDMETLLRSPVNAPRSMLNTSGDVAPRALMFGFHLGLDWGDMGPRLIVDGPSRQPSAYKKEILFVEPLVPSAPLRRASYGADAITKALKDSGLALTDLVREDSLVAAASVPVTPAPAAKGKAAASGDLLVTLSPSSVGTVLVIAHGGSSPRAEVVFSRIAGVAQSAAYLPNGDIAALIVTDANEEVFARIGGGTVTEVARLPAAPYGDAPANPDAIAIGPKGEIAVIRTPSGSEPPSANDPALLVLPGPRLTALAPWGSALAASDPACASGADDTYRATIQTSGTWVRVVGRSFPVMNSSGMTARVRWSASHLCVEALDVPDGPVAADATGRTGEAILTAAFAPDAAGRANVDLGREERTPMSCALRPR